MQDGSTHLPGDSSNPPDSSSGRSLHFGRRRRRRFEREIDAERGARARLALDSYVASVRSDDVLV